MSTAPSAFGTNRLRFELLVSRGANREQRERLAAIARGEVELVIGTHAVFQKQVQYHKLGLIVIDEQHRFVSSSA